MPYSYNFALVMYPFVVAATHTPIGASCTQYSCMSLPWWITMGGHCRPTAFTNVKMVDVSPCSPLTCVTLDVPSSPTTNCSLGTFCTPVSSPDQIWSGAVILRSSSTFSYSLNHFLMFGSLAHCAHAVDKLIDLHTFILGWCCRKNLAHLYLAFFVFVLKSFILFISANCQANFLTLLIISGKPAF